MASTPEEEEEEGGGNNHCGVEEDEDSGTGSTSNETHVIRHIDRNILACQICLHRYRLPKVRMMMLDILGYGDTLGTREKCHCNGYLLRELE